MELENIKTNNKDEQRRYRTREAIRDILSFENIYIKSPSQRLINKMIKKYNFLSDINDHHIICEASYLAKKIGE